MNRIAHITKALWLLAMMLPTIEAAAIVNVWPTDPLTIDALQYYHRSIGSLRLSERLTSLAELSSLKSHGATEKDMEATNKALDKYYRAIDWLDTGVAAFQSILQGYSTYRHVTEQLVDYVDMVDEYAKMVYESKGTALETSDLAILDILNAALPDIQSSFASLSVPLADLVRIALLKAPTTSSQMHQIFETVQRELALLDFKVTAMVNYTHEYLRYKKVRLMRPVIKVNYRQRVARICDETFAAWMGNAQQSASRTADIPDDQSKNPTSKKK